MTPAGRERSSSRGSKASVICDLAALLEVVVCFLGTQVRSDEGKVKYGRVECSNLDFPSGLFGSGASCSSSLRWPSTSIFIIIIRVPCHDRKRFNIAWSATLDLVRGFSPIPSVISTRTLQWRNRNMIIIPSFQHQTSLGDLSSSRNRITPRWTSSGLLSRNGHFLREQCQAVPPPEQSLERFI